MSAATYDFVFARSDTPTLGVILDGQNVLSLEIVPLPRPGDIISWTIGWPGARGSETKTSEPDGGLVTDARYRAIYWPITKTDLAPFAATDVAPFAIQVIESDGRAQTYLTGTLRVKD